MGGVKRENFWHEPATLWLAGSVRTVSSAQLGGEVRRIQMGVPLQHLQSLVPRDAGHLHRVKPLLEQTTGGLMPQVVKVEVNQPGTITRTHERAFDGLGRQPRKHWARLRLF